jgi:hypothetical protein
MKLLTYHSKELFGKQVITKFATVEEYFENLKGLDLKFPSYHSDFLPLVEIFKWEQSYWCGLFSSYPYLKAEIRKTQ